MPEGISLSDRVEKYSRHLQQGDTNQRERLHDARRYLTDHAITPEIAAKYSLGFVNPANKDDERYDGRLAIPYLTQAGVVAMKYRCVEDHNCKANGHVKYLAPYGQETWIFNPQAFFDADDIIGIAEGEIDAIVATEILGLPTVGIPGVDTWTQNRKVWRRTFEDYETVIIFVDGDPVQEDGKQPGRDMARAIADDVRSKTRLVFCDKSDDVASMVASGKVMQLKERAGLT